MAFFFNLNQTPANWVGCMMQLWQVMVSAGWTVLSWSDGAVGGGTTHGSPGQGFLGFSTSSAGIPNSTAGVVGSANNPDAWILMQQPTSSLSRGLPYGGTRQFTFQQSNVSTRTQWRVKYSLSGGYYPVPGSTGSVTATPSINPAVNDEVILFGGGTDTVPTFANCFNNGGAWEGAVRCHCMADDGTGPSGSIPDSPFSWLMFGANQGGNTTGMNFTGFPINFAFMFDAMEVGTAAPQDLDPFITYQENSGGAWCFNNGNNNWSAASNNSSNNPSGWMRKGQTNQAFTRLQALIPWTVETAALPGSMGGNHITFADDLIPVVYTRNASDGGLTGYKGISSLVRWNSTTRQTSDTLSISQPGFSRDRIIAALVSLPWDGSSVPVI